MAQPVDKEYTEAHAILSKTDEQRLAEENERLIEASKAEIDKVLTQMKRFFNQKLYRTSPLTLFPSLNIEDGGDE
jgi:hypothetical protein